jgi:hypothetical protein
MVSALMQLAPEHLSLLNSLLRNPDLTLREIARQTYPTMGAVVHRRSSRAWEMLLYRHKESKGHFRVVRSENVMADIFAVNDLVIKAIEEQLGSDAPVSLALLNAIKGAKVAPVSLTSKLEDAINAKIGNAVSDSSNTIPRSPDRNYI